jgi:hypothetical protein
MATTRNSGIISRTRLTIQILAIALLIARSTLHAEPDKNNYRLRFAGSPPTSGAQALSTFNDRSGTILQFLACGLEADFADGATLRDRPDKNPKFADAEDVGEGMLHMVMAKMIIYSSWPNHATQIPGTHQFTCQQDVTFSVKPARTSPAEQNTKDPAYLAALQDDIDSQKARINALNSHNLFGEVCAGESGMPSSDADAATITVRYSVSRECLRKQINQYMMAAYVNGIPGSSGLPCFPVPIGTTDGEWDVILKEITRIYYLNDQTGRSALDEDVRTHIRDQLLTLDGPPGPASYNIGECGDSEISVGPPSERADERNWTHSALEDVGDALGWLLKWLARLAAAAVGLGVAFAVLSALVGPLLAAQAIAIATALAAAAITFGDIPESENHRLMIESSRYLNNQIIGREIDPQDSNAQYISDDQAKVREWLLKKLQLIAKDDFVEYNARPYQRYSIAAIRNLADFSRDDAIVKAARNILDLTTAKMAMGSNQGRRLVPYRRLMEAMQTSIEPDGIDVDSGNLLYNGLFDMERGADHQIALTLAYTGQTQQTVDRAMTPAAFDEMIFAAASAYRPPESVLDLAIDKSTPYQQKVKHAAAEIYSSTPGYLLTAGGVQAGPSSTIQIAGISAGGSILGLIPLSNTKDRGAAVPTTLMLSSGFGRSSMEVFLRISGNRQKYDDKNATYDNNLCVYGGFACGLNVKTPPDMEACFVPGPSGSPSQWSFFDTFDSTECARAFSVGPRVMIARYLETCHNDQTGECTDNVGFFEAVSDPGVDFLTFQNRILANNPAGVSAGWLRLIGGIIASKRTLLSGQYVTFTGDKIEFDTSAHQLDSDRTGIVSVNGNETPKLSSWKRLEGDVLKGDADSLVFQFTNPKTHHGFSVDMSDWNNPKSGTF